MQPLACASCGASFRAADLDVSSQVAACHACGAVLDLKSRTAADDAQLEKLTRPGPAPVPMPEHFVVTDSNSRFEVRWSWGQPPMRLVFGIASIISIVSIFVFPLVVPALAAFRAFEVLIALPVLYMTAAQFLNSTSVALDRGVLSVKHGPLPWLGNGSWTRQELAQLYCEALPGERRQQPDAYRLCGLLRDARRITLVTHVRDRAQVQWLEQTFERRLEIVDVPVQGELAK